VRLRGKSLLTVGGMPLVLLVMGRAATTGRETVLATTTRQVDDALAGIVREAGYQVFRGPTDDIRSRFLGTVRDLDDGDVVVRITGDNPVPDGDLIERLIDEFISSDLDHLESGGIGRTLPYGVSVEVLSAGSLRRSCGWRTTEEDREHVTTALRDLGRSRVSSIGHRLGDLSHLRCTIDTFDDWMLMEAVFGSVRDPLRTSWTELVELVASKLPVGSHPQDLRLVLGTAQLAQPYGTVRTVEPSSRQEAIQMVRSAVLNGLWIDTAPAYGGAEDVIGDALRDLSRYRVRVVTKCKVPTHVNHSSDVVRAVMTSVEKSREKLGTAIDLTVLLHDPSQMDLWGGAAWQALVEAKRSGTIDKIGVSVDGPASLSRTLEHEDVDVVQLAVNILDHRWARPEVTELLDRRMGVEIHCRSVFLQGVLLRDEEDWPRIEGLDVPRITDRLGDLVTSLGRRDKTDLCLAWIKGPHTLRRHLTAVIVGADSLAQLDRNMIDFECAPLTSSDVESVAAAIPLMPESLLNPASWPT